MDNKDQRNGTVPLGTFNQDTAAQHGDEAGTADITGAYVRADDIQLEAIDDTPVDFVTARPGRKRVRTLLGVPLVNARAPASASITERSDQISQAIQNMLDSQASQRSQAGLGDQSENADGLASTIDIEIDEVELESDVGVLLPDEASASEAELRDATLSEADALSASASEAEVILWAEPAHASATTQEFENRPTTPGTTSSSALPLLIPSQYADAQARDRAEVEVARTSVAEEPPTVTVIPAASRASRRPQSRVSSLAPRETTRRQAERDAAPGIGFLWVAAMALIAGAGWYFTAGSFSRTAQPQAAVTQPPAAPVNDAPMAAPAPPVVQAPAPSAPEAPPPIAATPRPTTKHALAANSRTPRSKAPPAPKLVPDNLAETPSRGEVVQRLEAVRPSVRACAAGLSGVADLDITIAHSGVVTHVLVGGDFAGTTQGSCIARAVREARFQSFKQERFRLLYPYAI
jgi:cytochrome c-type biogenesis protein CcmH/NrfG